MTAFFDSIRADFGKLSQGQVEGVERLVKAASALSIPHQAYVLATAWHETAATMQPIYERGNKSYFSKYDGRKDLGNMIAGDGYRFRGRGYVQITGRRNYDKFSNLLGVDLVANPDLALRPDVSAKIIVEGMSGGLFTSKAMKDYSSYRDMRRVVNGTDAASKIAGYAVKFEKALRLLDAPNLHPQSQTAPGPQSPIPTENAKTDAELPPKPNVSIKAAGLGVIGFILALIWAAFGVK
jgi:putative chitinase